MAINKIYAETQENNRPRDLSLVTTPSGLTTIQPGTPVILGSRPAVSITASGNGTKTDTNIGGNILSVTYGNGGASLADNQATFAFDGTFEFAVDGATATTKDEVAVFITSDGELTLTESGNTRYGITDYPTDYRREAGIAPVKIGA